MGLSFHSPKSGIDIGLEKDVCVECTRGLPRSEIYMHYGKLKGTKVYKTKSLQNEDICICLTCLQKLYKSAQHE